MVRLNSEKHIEFDPSSPYAGGKPGRCKRKNQRKALAKAEEDEEDEET